MDCFALYCQRGDWKNSRLSVGLWEAVGGISDGFPRENGQKGLRNVSKWRREGLEFGGYTVVGIGR